MEKHEEGRGTNLDPASIVQVQGSEGQDKGNSYRNGKKRMHVIITENSIGLCECRLTGSQGEKGIKMVL